MVVQIIQVRKCPTDSSALQPSSFRSHRGGNWWESRSPASAFLQSLNTETDFLSTSFCTCTAEAISLHARVRGTHQAEASNSTLSNGIQMSLNYCPARQPPSRTLCIDLTDFPSCQSVH